MIRNDAEMILDKTPKLVVLELESNDLCDPHCDGQTIASALKAFVHLLHAELHVKFTTVCETIHWTRPPFPRYQYISLGYSPLWFGG